MPAPEALEVNGLLLAWCYTNEHSGRTIRMECNDLDAEDARALQVWLEEAVDWLDQPTREQAIGGDGA